VLEGAIREGDTVQIRTRGEALQLQKRGEAQLGWASGSRDTSENKNDVVVLKNHQGFASNEDDENAFDDDSFEWVYDDLEKAK